MNKESEMKKKEKKLKGRKSGLASTRGGAALAPASVEAGLVTCAQVIRPPPRAMCFSLKVIMSTFYQKYVFLRRNLTSLASCYIRQVAGDTS